MKDVASDLVQKVFDLGKIGFINYRYNDILIDHPSYVVAAQTALDLDRIKIVFSLSHIDNIVMPIGLSDRCQ